MEERVSGGAIIQHISKLRQRLETMGKNVPPPPRRGGGYGNSNSKSQNTSISTPAAPRRTRAAANIKSNMKASETEEEEIDIEGGPGSDEEFGSGKPKVEKTDDTRIKQERKSSAGNAGGKRKRVGDSNSPVIRSKGSPAGKPHKRKSRKTNHGTSVSGSSGEDNDQRNETPESDNDRHQQDSIGRQYLAAGADFFQDYDEEDVSMAPASSYGESDGASRAVVLRFGESERAKTFLQHMQSQEKAAPEADEESVGSSSTTSIARFDGGKESIVHGGGISSNIAGVNYPSMSSGHPSYLSQEYNQRLQQISPSNPSGSFFVHPSYNSIELGNDSQLSGNNAIYNSSVISNPHFHVSDDWDFRSMPADMVSANFTAPVGYSAHMSQQPSPRVFEPSNIHSNSFIYQSSHASNLGQEQGWSAPPAFDHGSVTGSRPIYVAPTEVSGNHSGVTPVLYENAFSRSQASSRRRTRQVQGSGAVNNASFAETPVSAFPAVNSFLPENDSVIQAPGFKIPEDLIWNDFIDDFHGVDDVFNTTLMTDIPNEGNEGTQAER